MTEKNVWQSSDLRFQLYFSDLSIETKWYYHNGKVEYSDENCYFMAKYRVMPVTFLKLMGRTHKTYLNTKLRVALGRHIPVSTNIHVFLQGMSLSKGTAACDA